MEAFELAKQEFIEIAQFSRKTGAIVEYLKFFVGGYDCHKELIATWFELHTDYEDAMTFLMRKFKQAYKDTTKKTYKVASKPDLSPLFAQSVAKKAAIKNGALVLEEATNTTAEKIILRLKRVPKVQY
ncbi:hypothetical protein DFQ29_009657 [Apophysomyces sp. BC1021]|nr:hypothetical protein DFQ29_009657 [Apophysomyces sp. BC1021]